MHAKVAGTIIITRETPHVGASDFLPLISRPYVCTWRVRRGLDRPHTNTAVPRISDAAAAHAIIV